jgi:hypothetical protein
MHGIDSNDYATSVPELLKIGNASARRNIGVNTYYMVMHYHPIS